MSDIIIVALIAVVPNIAVVLLTAWRLGRKTEAVHQVINSRLSELLDATRRSAHAEGKALGRAESRAERHAEHQAQSDAQDRAEDRAESKAERQAEREEKP